MGTLKESAYTGTVKSAEEMLALWQKCESDIAETGQSYFAPGGVNYTMADLDKVAARVRYWEQRVLAKRGMTGRNYADIEPGTSEDAESLT